MDQEPKKAPQSFSFGRLIAETKLTGLAASIAMHSEPVFYNADLPFLRLELPREMSAFKNSPAMENLKRAFKQYLGDDLEIEMVDGPANNSLANRFSSKKIESIKEAHVTIMNDPMVQKMLKNLGAKILLETVKPVAASIKP